MRYLRRRDAVLLIVAIFAAWGCEGSSAPAVSSSTEEATVKGTVTINGKPATEGEVVFDPANISRRNASTSVAAIGKDGSYTAKTLVGQNTVSVRGPQVSKTPGLSMNQKVFDVKSGENVLPIELP